MKTDINLLKRLVKRFGKKYGIRLFLNLTFNQLHDIRLPGLKNSISLRHDSSDIEMFLQIFLNKEYAIDFKFEPKFVIDGGANIGLFTILIKNKFPDAIIISVEPDIDNFKLLKENISGYEGIYCENHGLWNKRTNLKIHDKYELGKWAMVVEETAGDGDLSSISINDLIQNYSIDRIDLLKLDIETSEKAVFRDTYESWLPKTKMIIIELHDWMEEGCARPFFKAINKSFHSYRYLIRGENTIIINNDID